MESSKENYAKAWEYEWFMTKVYGNSITHKTKVHLTNLKNVLDIESGLTNSKHLGSHEKQFNKVKNYISKALIKVSKTAKYKQDSDLFLILNDKIDYCDSGDDLLLIIMRAKKLMNE